MTLQRQERKGRAAPVPYWLVPAVVMVGMLLPLAAASAQATTERVVIDRVTGLAISGFDPVGYFTDAAPLAGREQFEAIQDGAVWRFRNEGNRAAFLRNPEVYQPQFGGYDPVDVARGVAVSGGPQLWIISEQRLFLFSSEANRKAFAADAKKISAAAQRRWPKVRTALAQ